MENNPDMENDLNPPPLPEDPSASLPELEEVCQEWTERALAIIRTRSRAWATVSEHVLIPDFSNLEMEEALTSAEIYNVGRILARVLTLEKELELELARLKKGREKAAAEAQEALDTGEAAAKLAQQVDELNVKHARAVASGKLAERGVSATAAEKQIPADPDVIRAEKTKLENDLRRQAELATLRKLLTEARYAEGDGVLQHQYLSAYENRKALEALLNALERKCSLIPGMQGVRNAQAKTGY